jgi:hypothetical protein
MVIGYQDGGMAGSWRSDVRHRRRRHARTDSSRRDPMYAGVGVVAGSRSWAELEETQLRPHARSA